MAYREEGTITLSLIAKDLASGKIGQAVASLDKLAQKGSLVGAVAQGVGQSFGQMLNPVGLVTKGIGTLTDFIGDSVGAASDLQESISKVNVVFGDSADQIQEWSKTSASSVLMSRQAALEAAGTFGNLFDALDLTEQATVDMSKGAVQLAADLASFNNVGTEETLLAIRSGLLGEAEPMRKFGSALSAARVQAYGVAHGLADAKGVMSEAQKVQARYALILEDTANAQGDVERSSGNLAAQQKQLDANMADLSATIGGFIVGPAAQVTEWLNDLTGGSGIRNGAIARAVEEWKDLNKVIAETKPPAEGDWALSGTLLDSLIDGLNNVNDALLDTIIPQSVWVEKTELLGKTAGFTRDDMLQLAKTIKDNGGAYEDYLKVLERAALDNKMAAQAAAGKTLEHALVGAAAGLKGVATAVPPATAAVRSGVDRIEDALDSLVDISRTTLKDTRSEIRDRMRDINDALEHPFRDDKLEKTYQTAIKNATKRMNKALREGNEEAYAEASQFVEDYKAKLRELRMQRFRVRVSMFVDDSGVTGPGATLLGGLAGSAWGHKPARRATGGPVSGGQAYLVGENGPELLTMGPGTSGVVTPGHRAGGGVNLYVQTLVADEASLTRGVRMLLPELQRAMGRQF